MLPMLTIILCALFSENQFPLKMSGLVVPQNTHSSVHYGKVGEQWFWYEGTRNGLLEPQPQSRQLFRQSGDYLVVFNPLGGPFHLYHPKTGYRKVPQMGAAWCVEVWGDKLYTGRFSNDQLDLQIYDLSGKALKSESFEIAIKQRDYTSKSLHSALVGGELHLWLPASGDYFKVDAKFTLLDRKAISLPEHLAAFSITLWSEMDAFSGNPEGLKAFCLKNQGMPLRLEPVTMFEMKGKLNLVYNAIEIAGYDHANKAFLPEIKNYVFVLGSQGIVDEKVYPGHEIRGRFDNGLLHLNRENDQMLYSKITYE